MKNTLILNITGIITGLFGLITLFMTVSVIFGLFGIREKEGNYVLFIVIANLMCSFLYLFAAYGFFTRKRWTRFLLMLAVFILVFAFAGLLFFISTGGVFEVKTVYAMIFRTILTFVFAVIASRGIGARG